MIWQNHSRRFKKKLYFCTRKIIVRTMGRRSQTSDNLRDLLDKSRNYCALAEQCEDAVRQKLIKWGASPAESDEVVAKLYDERYLDDERFARAYCESKILHQHWGRQKVLYQLRLKHLPRTAVDSGMAAVSNEDYFAVLTEVAEKKYHELIANNASPEGEREVSQKLTSFLVTRGFLLSEINQVIPNILNQ